MVSTNEHIDDFVSYFQRHLSAIDQISLPENIKKGDRHVESRYKKTLYVAVIDSLSKVVYPRSGNRDRMIAFLKEFSEWDNHDKVSLPLLRRFLTKSPEPAFGKLRDFVNGKMSNWHSGEIIPIGRDPSISEIRKLWPNPQKEHFVPVAGITLESLQHANLLYVYRNMLVHEFREPGSGTELSSSDEPFYFHMTTYDVAAEFDTWELVYPIGFFKQRCETSLRNLEGYLRQNQFDPIPVLTGGSYWIEGLD